MKKNKWGSFKIYLTIVIFFTILCFSVLHANEIRFASETIHALSKEEKTQLKLFFRNLFVHDELGYTLFGDKPMSFCFPYTFKPQFTSGCIFKLSREGDIPFAKALALWKKIGFNRDSYSVIVYEDSGYPTCVMLINRHQFINIVNKNIDAFKSVYGKSIDALWVLKNIEDKVIDQDELFKQHLLLGIMLGYGRHSAELFQRRWQIAYGEFRPPFLQHPQIPREGFFSIERELNYLTEHLQSAPKTFEWYTNTFPLLLKVTTVAFAFDPDDPEAQALIKKYKALHAKLTEIFDSSDWLELVLNKLL